MCSDDNLAKMGKVSRRRFAAIGAGAGLSGAVASCAPMGEVATASGVQERRVTFAAPGGTMDGVFLHPADGSYPGVILWPDIAGLRPAKIEMGRRLAGEGYAVFVANPYYRSVSGQQFADFEAWREAGGMQAGAEWRARNTPQAVMETARAVVQWLDAQEAVDNRRGIGNQGYCMTGGWTIMAAAAVPSRVKAAASFHGGGLTGEGERVPVNLFDDTADDARALIAIARDDDAEDPAAKQRLREAAEQAGLVAEIEVYAGDHGWTVLDSPAYDRAAAERAYSELLALYSAAL